MRWGSELLRDLGTSALLLVGAVLASIAIVDSFEPEKPEPVDCDLPGRTCWELVEVPTTTRPDPFERELKPSPRSIEYVAPLWLEATLNATTTTTTTTTTVPPTTTITAPPAPATTAAPEPPPQVAQAGPPSSVEYVVSWAQAGPTCGIIHWDNIWLAHSILAEWGWHEGRLWDDYVRLTNRESGFCETARNQHGSSAYGIGQFLDSTWAGTGYSKTDDPELQIRAMMRYIADRYGDPSAAWAHSQATGWY